MNLNVFLFGTKCNKVMSFLHSKSFMSTFLFVSSNARLPSFLPLFQAAIDLVHHTNQLLIFKPPSNQLHAHRRPRHLFAALVPQFVDVAFTFPTGFVGRRAVDGRDHFRDGDDASGEVEDVVNSLWRVEF